MRECQLSINDMKLGKKLYYAFVDWEKVQREEVRCALKKNAFF